MSKEKNTITLGPSVSFCELLGLLFIGLKLGGVINWGWEWVLLPIYGPLLLFLACLIVGLTVVVVATIFAILFDTK